MTRPLICLALTLALVPTHVPSAVAAPPPDGAAHPTWMSYYDSAARNIKIGDKAAALADYHLADRYYEGPPEGGELSEIVYRIVQYEHELYVEDYDLRRLCRARERLDRYYSSLPDAIARQRRSGFRGDEQQIERALKKVRHTCPAPEPEPIADSPSQTSESEPAHSDEIASAPAAALSDPASDSSDASPPPSTSKDKQTKPAPLPAVGKIPKATARSTRARGLVIGGAVSLGLGAGFLAMMIAGATLSSSFFKNPDYRLDCMYMHPGSWADNCITESQRYADRNKAFMTVGGLLAGAGLAAGVLLLRAGLRERRGRVALGPQLHQPGAVLRVAF